MNVARLRRAAQMLQEQNPELSQEINQIAQGIESVPQPTENPTPNTNDMVSDQGMNPNIDQKYVKPTAGKIEVHRITLTIEVPENTDETFLINTILKFRETLSDKGFRLKGYSFDEKSQG